MNKPLLTPVSLGKAHFDDSTDRLRLSVVVIGRNEGIRLVRCIESIMRMRPLNGSIEVIYVDSGSTDGSVERAERLNLKVISLNSTNPCAAAGRNAGWRASRAPILLFLDGDTMLEPNFVVDSIGELKDPRIAVVFGDRREIDPNGSIYNRVLDLDWLAPVGPVEFCGGEALIRREVLERVGGYDEHLIAAEDTELCSRIRALGYVVLHVDRLMVHHDLAITRFSQYWRRGIRTGYAYAEVSERIRRCDLPNWYLQARRNRLQGSLLTVAMIAVPSLIIAYRSITGILFALTLTTIVVARTAFRSRWKKAPMTTRILHALHSHLMQIPLVFGQVKYELNKLRGKAAILIEYKGLKER